MNTRVSLTFTIFTLFTGLFSSKIAGAPELLNDETDQAHTAPWQDSTSSVLSRTKYLLSTMKYADVIITVGNKSNWEELKAHSLLLGMSSPVFESMLLDPLNGTEDFTLEVPDLTPRVFKKLLRYMYADDTTSSNMIDDWDLWFAATKYKLKPLIEATSQQISKSININSVWDALNKAQQYGEKTMEEICFQFIISSGSSSFEHPRFFQMERRNLLRVISSPILNITEVKIFQGLLQWAKNALWKDGKNETGSSLRENIGLLLPYIQFDKMTADEFVTTVIPTKVLTTEETSELILNHIKTLLPTGKISQDRRTSMASSCSRKNSTTKLENPWQSHEEENYVSFRVTCPHICYFLGFIITDSLKYRNELVSFDYVHMTLSNDENTKLVSIEKLNVGPPYAINLTEPVELKSNHKYTLYLKLKEPVENEYQDNNYGRNRGYYGGRVPIPPKTIAIFDFNTDVSCSNNIDITFVNNDHSATTFRTSKTGIIPTLFIITKPTH